MLRFIVISLMTTTLSFGDFREDVRSAAIKIVSKSSPTSSELRGSGLVFSKDGKLYVLTSDHVVHHGASIFGVKLTHEGSHSITGAKLTMKYIASEWGNGLAVMEVEKTSIPIKGVPYEVLIKKGPAKLGGKNLLLGYPYESNDLTEESEAILLDAKKTQPYFLTVPALYEFECLVGEFGMSGGPAFAADGSFSGVLAYQVILNGNTSEETTNRVYTIPPHHVGEWLQKVFAEKEQYKPLFSEPAWGQQSNEQVLLTNDKYSFMFRSFGGINRMMMARMEAWIFFKGEPTVFYDDKRGILKQIRADLDKNPIRPGEIAIVDRSGGAPQLVKIRYPAEAITRLDRLDHSLFLVRGEKHEDRYKRYAPAVKNVVDSVEALRAKTSEKVILSLLDKVVIDLKTVPEKPTWPEPESAAEFFHPDFLGKMVFDIETIQAMPQWKALPQSEGKAVQDALLKLITAVDVVEFKGL